MINDFDKQLKMSQDIETQNDFDTFYKKVYGEDIIIKRYDKDTVAQRDYGVDVIIILPNGVRVSIDEKLRSDKYNHYPEYCIELDSNYENGKRGWLYTNLSQYICYGNCKTGNKGLISCFMFPLNFHFKRFIINSLPELEENNKIKFAKNYGYNTRFALVHWRHIEKFVGRDNIHQLNLTRFDKVGY